ncbi:hypothetical protein HY407_03480, partial [Candidatus Gottesmanbacteria bacterium]|nr:hypothetical protein [Candidatus Gottesmanbacteria bacterium]
SEVQNFKFQFDLSAIPESEWKKIVPADRLGDIKIRVDTGRGSPCGDSNIHSGIYKSTDIVKALLVPAPDVQFCNSGGLGGHYIKIFVTEGNDREFCTPGKYEIIDRAEANISINPVEIQYLSGVNSWKTVPALPDEEAYWEVNIKDVNFTAAWIRTFYQTHLDLNRSQTNSVNLSTSEKNSTYLFLKGNLGDKEFWPFSSNAFSDSVKFILKPLPIGAHAISIWGAVGEWIVTVPFKYDYLISKSFQVYPKGETPPNTPTPQARRAPPDSTIAPDIDTRNAPQVKAICEQSDSSEAREKCLDCMDPTRNTPNKGIWTAIGCVPTDVQGIVSRYILNWPGFGIAGAIAFLYFLYGAFLILTSMGNPEKVNEGREIMTSSVAGLLLIIFSVLIMRIAAVDILRVPGFGPTPTPKP